MTDTFIGIVVEEVAHLNRIATVLAIMSGIRPHIGQMHLDPRRWQGGRPLWLFKPQREDGRTPAARERAGSMVTDTPEIILSRMRHQQSHMLRNHALDHAATPCLALWLPFDVAEALSVEGVWGGRSACLWAFKEASCLWRPLHLHALCSPALPVALLPYRD
jgi:hypothetical protein